MTKDSIKHSIVKHLAQSLAKDPERATRRDWWMATCYTIRDQIMETFIECQKAQREKNVKRVYYFSLEYLIGRLLNTNVDNLNLKKPLLQALKELGQNYEDLRQEEVEMGR